MTEKQTEDWLVSSARKLTLPNGETFIMREFAHFWETFDLIPKTGVYTQAQLIEYAVMHVEETGEPFDTALRRVCGYVHRKLTSE